MTMGWLLLRTVILLPLVFAIAVLVLIAIGLCAALRPLLRRHSCVAPS
jgi:hypothetical protein